MSEFPEITNILVQERSATALRQFIGPKKQYSYADVAEAIDVDQRTVESWVLGQAVPVLYKWLKLCALLGAEYTNQYLRLAGQDGAGVVYAKRITDAQMNAEAAKLVSTFSDALADLRIDHTERPRVLRVARETHTMLTDFLQENERTPQLREVK